MARIAEVVSILAAPEQVERREQLQMSLYPWPGEMLSLRGELRAWIEDVRDARLYLVVRLEPVMVLLQSAQNKRSFRPVLKHWQSLAYLGNAGDSP